VRLQAHAPFCGGGAVATPPRYPVAKEANFAKP
jgi:hypothetical protein